MQKSGQILNVLMHTTHFFSRSVRVDSHVGKASFIQLISQLWIPHRTL